MSQLPKGNPRIPEGINHRNQNPLKEFTQLLLATITILFTVFLILYFFAERLLVFVPFSWEEKLANQFPSVSSIISNELDNSCFDEKDLAAANKALEKLTKELAGAANLSGPIKIKPKLIISDQQNAFATIGGYIFITSALLETIKTENGLAMVIAHEIGHVKQRHPIRSLGSAILVQSGFALLGLGNNNITSLAQAGSMLGMMRFSRDMERESDNIALGTLNNHYRTVSGADEFFNEMQKQRHSPAWQAILQTHPATEQRIANIQRQSQQSQSKPLTLLPVALTKIQQCNQHKID